MRALLALALIAGLTAPAPAQMHPGEFAACLVVAHNRERAAFGSPPLGWDPALAAAAQGHANRLAPSGRLRHSNRAARRGQGENLWIGRRGGFAPEAMVGNWAAERRFFRPGPFPANSGTGNWMHVGHFTQIVWPATNRIGCGLASTGRWDVLVCRYAPAGNVDGVWIGRR